MYVRRSGNIAPSRALPFALVLCYVAHTHYTHYTDTVTLLSRRVDPNVTTLRTDTYREVHITTYCSHSLLPTR